MDGVASESCTLLYKYKQEFSMNVAPAGLVIDYNSLLWLDISEVCTQQVLF